MSEIFEGVVVGGSYNQQTATCLVQVGDTANPDPESEDAPLVVQATIKTTSLGRLYGPVGGERATLEPCGNGYVASFEHADDDTSAPARGETFDLHADPTTVGVPGQSPTYNGGVKYTNDGPTAGDNLGGTIVGNNGGLTQSQTKSGHVISQNDTTQQIIAKSAGGHTVTWDDVAKTLTVLSAGGHTVVLNDAIQQVLVKSNGGLQHLLNDVNGQIQHIAGPVTTTLDSEAQKLTHTINSVQVIVDGAGNAISHIATKIGLGDLPGNLPASAAAIANTHLTTFESSLFTKRLDDLTKFATAMVSAGVPNAGAVIGELATLLHVPVPAGSAITFVK